MLMTDLLSRLVGKKVDLRCGVATSIRGEIIKVEGGVVQLRESDDKICFVAITRS